MERIIKILFIALIITIACTVVSSADDFTIEEAWWDDSGSLTAEWDECLEDSSYKVRLYKDKKPVGRTATTKNSSYDFGSIILTNGKGSYYFTVYPTKGGETYLRKSSSYSVLTSTITQIKEYKKTHPNEEEEADNQPLRKGWISNPGGTWSYYSETGERMKDCWVNDGGFSYLIDSKGATLYGWQYYKNRWYYLEPKGAEGHPQGSLYVSCITPDGYTVNEKGEWVQDGNVVTTKNTTSGTKSQTSSAKSTQKSIRKIGNCAITLKEDAASTDKVSYAEPTGATNAVIEKYTYSIPYENWKAGNSIDITVSIVPKDGYVFSNSTAFSCSKAKVINYTKSGASRTVKLRFTPQQKLESPSGLYCYEDDTVIHWDAVKYAKRYRVEVYNGSKKLKSVIVSETSYDIGDYLYNDEYQNTIKIKISTLAAENNTAYKESSATEIADAESWLDTHTVPDDFERNGKKVTYSEPGWQYIAGDWYNFNDSGTARSGWYEDKEAGLWYYLDPDTRKMRTGTVVVDGVSYFLNDGSITTLPLGAWVEGR